MPQQNLLFDSHAHLFSSPIGTDVPGMLIRAQAAGISQIVNICIDSPSIKQGIQIAHVNPWVYNAGAVHPHDVDQQGDVLFEEVVHHAQAGDFVAIGETGLDYHYTHSSKDNQQRFLRKHLELAQKCKLPVIIHCREAFPDLFKILDSFPQTIQGVMHCFTGTLEEAKQSLARGWYISFSGIITFKKSVELRDIAREIPLDWLLIETDAPFLAPQSHRGKPNEPAFIVETAQVLAATKGISFAELAKATTDNARRLFKIG